MKGEKFDKNGTLEMCEEGCELGESTRLSSLPLFGAPKNAQGLKEPVFGQLTPFGALGHKRARIHVYAPGSILLNSRHNLLAFRPFV